MSGQPPAQSPLVIVLRSAAFTLALLLITPPYSILALATFPLPRLVRYRVITGWSRIVLGAHFPVDVFAGVVVGWAGVAAVGPLAQRVARNLKLSGASR